LNEWLAEMKASGIGADTRMNEAELRSQGAEFLRVLAAAVNSGSNIGAESWAPVRQFLENLSRSRAIQGFSSEETATFIFSLKKPLFARIRKLASNSAETLAEATWTTSELIDKLGLHTVKTFQKSREDVINRQQEEMLELSTPVVKLWEGIIALPMIGTLDSARTQIVMESLLQRIVETGAEIAIIDITGVPTVDTLVAQHLLKTVTAIRLMGADCIISGIRPQIAQTIVHLGVELQGITTKANLADALAIALKRAGMTITKTEAA
jgi:rsbT co-antagonist protein RsbR